MHSLKSRQGRDKHPPKSSWLRFLLARKRVPPAVSTACADETIAVKNISQKAPTAISSGRMPPGRKKNSDREGGVEGGMRGGCLPPPAVSWWGGDSGGGSGDVGGGGSGGGGVIGAGWCW